MDRLFADTYALIEILKGSESYQRHAMCELVTTEFNLLELAYALLRDFREDDVETILGRVRDNIEVIKVTDREYIEASKFRIQVRRRKKKLSLTDCLGYVTAKKLGIKFLTGDREFEDLDNVEYVK